jgi:SPX domain protein involved in polyphosphate accumulation
VAAANEQENAQDIQVQDQNTTLRRQLSNAYAALLGDQTRQSFAAFTFEEALDAQIERIEGAGTSLRPNLLDRVSRVESQVVQAIQQLKDMRPEAFIKPEEGEDVNTPTE